MARPRFSNSWHVTQAPHAMMLREKTHMSLSVTSDPLSASEWWLISFVMFIVSCYGFLLIPNKWHMIEISLPKKLCLKKSIAFTDLNHALTFMDKVTGGDYGGLKSKGGKRSSWLTSSCKKQSSSAKCCHLLELSWTAPINHGSQGWRNI